MLDFLPIFSNLFWRQLLMRMLYLYHVFISLINEIKILVQKFVNMTVSIALRFKSVDIKTEKWENSLKKKIERVGKNRTKEFFVDILTGELRFFLFRYNAVIFPIDCELKSPLHFLSLYRFCWMNGQKLNIFSHTVSKIFGLIFYLHW